MFLTFSVLPSKENDLPTSGQYLLHFSCIEKNKKIIRPYVETSFETCTTIRITWTKNRKCRRMLFRFSQLNHHGELMGSATVRAGPMSEELRSKLVLEQSAMVRKMQTGWSMLNLLKWNVGKPKKTWDGSWGRTCPLSTSCHLSPSPSCFYFFTI